MPLKAFDVARRYFRFRLPDLTLFCRLAELGLVVTAQRHEPARVVPPFPVVDPDDRYHRCHCPAPRAAPWCACWRTNCRLATHPDVRVVATADNFDQMMAGIWRELISLHQQRAELACTSNKPGLGLPGRAPALGAARSGFQMPLGSERRSPDTAVG